MRVQVIATGFPVSQNNRSAHLQSVPLDIVSSSSSDACLLPTRDAFLELFTEFAFELGAEDCLERAFLDTVLPLSRACLLRSCMGIDWPERKRGGSPLELAHAEVVGPQRLCRSA